MRIILFIILFLTTCFTVNADSVLFSQELLPNNDIGSWEERLYNPEYKEWLFINERKWLFCGGIIEENNEYSTIYCRMNDILDDEEYRGYFNEYYLDDEYQSLAEMEQKWLGKPEPVKKMD